LRIPAAVGSTIGWGIRLAGDDIAHSGSSRMNEL
jgi:hypothetical protein